MPVEVFGKREGKIIIKREKWKEKDLNARGRETDKQIEASEDRGGRVRWMSRFRVQEIRGEIKAWRNRGRGGRGAPAAYNVYMRQYIVERVCLLMSLTGTTEHAHTEDDGACRYQDTHTHGERKRRSKSDDMLVKRKYVF